MNKHIASSQSLHLSLGERAAAAVLGVGRPVVQTMAPVPPAVVFSATSGRHMTADLDGSDLRGSGLGWPPAAWIDETLPLRLPAATAWLDCVADEPGPEWAHAIACMVRAIAAKSPGDAASPIHLIVPDSLREDQADALQSALYSTSVTLVWRPIAAAVGWLRRFGGTLSSLPERGGSLGHLVCIHAGLDGVEVTPIEIRTADSRGRSGPIPARRLPRVPPLGAPAQEIFADLLYRGGDRSAAEQWYRTWIDPQRLREIEAGVADAIRASRRPEGGSLFTTTRHQWQEWCAKVVAALPSPIIGQVATGSLCTVAHRAGHQPLELLCGGPHTERCMVRSMSDRFLARGAARVAEAWRADRDGYLDTLPKLEMLVTRRGEPHWEDLTSQDPTDPAARYVRGGREVPWTPKGSIMKVGRGVPQLELLVHREGSRTVRESSTRLPRPPKSTTSVTLQVFMNPGQGSPRIEVHPEPHDAFGGVRVSLDWRHARDTHKSPAEAEAKLPRTNPPINPRRASQALWEGSTWPGKVSFINQANVSTALENMLDHDGRPLSTLAEFLKLASKEFQRPAEKAPKPHTTAVDSDGKLAADAGRYAVFEATQALIDEALTGEHGSDTHDAALRCAGYISADSIIVHRAIMNRLELAALGGGINDACLTAAGNCLRDPLDIARFINLAVRAAQLGNSTLNNNWLRTLTRPIQYREDALQHVNSSNALRLAVECVEVFEDNLRLGKPKQLFRNAALCIVYLLRRRRYDDAFVDPESDFARRVTNAFTTASDRIAAGSLTPVGGVIATPQLLKQLIEYIQRRGHGIVCVD